MRMESIKIIEEDIKEIASILSSIYALDEHVELQIEISGKLVLQRSDWWEKMRGKYKLEMRFLYHFNTQDGCIHRGKEDKNFRHVVKKCVDCKHLDKDGFCSIYEYKFPKYHGCTEHEENTLSPQKDSQESENLIKKTYTIEASPDFIKQLDSLFGMSHHHHKKLKCPAQFGIILKPGEQVFIEPEPINMGMISFPPPEPPNTLSTQTGSQGKEE